MPAVLAILAAGSSSRAGVDKVLADLGGHPVLVWSLVAGQVAGCFREIVVVDRQMMSARFAQTSSNLCANTRSSSTSFGETRAR